MQVQNAVSDGTINPFILGDLALTSSFSMDRKTMSWFPSKSSQKLSTSTPFSTLKQELNTLLTFPTQPNKKDPDLDFQKLLFRVPE